MHRVIVLLLSLLAPLTASAQDCPSPTGYRPKMLGTNEWQCRWKRIAEAKHPWLAVLTGNAAIAGRYSNYGRWQALEYQRTGNEAMAAAALKEWNPRAQTAGNDQRESGIEFVALRELLKPYLEKIGRLAEVDGYLKQTAENLLKGERFGDSDAAVTTWLALALTDQALGTSYLSRTIIDGLGGKAKPVGGLVATGANNETLRNNFKLIVQLGAGGFWPESTMYNVGTVSLVSMGCEFLRQSTGADQCPEFTAFREARIKHVMHEITPNLRDAFQQGDEQQPSRLRSIDFDHFLPAMHGTPGDATWRAALRTFEDDVRAANQWGEPTAGKNPVYARMMYFADPFADKTTWRDRMGTWYTAPGQGMSYWRDDRGAGSTSMVTFANGIIVDHMLAFCMGNLRLWDTQQQRWALHNPNGYAPDQRFCNITTVANISPATVESSRLAASGHKPGEVSYTAGITAGLAQPIFAPYFDPPPTYMHGYARSVVSLHDGGEWVTVVHDWANVDDPRTQIMSGGRKALTRYAASIQTKMTNARGLIDTIWHAPVTPTITADGRELRWPVGTKDMRVMFATPAAPPVVTIADESADICPPAPTPAPAGCLNGYMEAASLKFAAHVVPAADAAAQGVREHSAITVLTMAADVTAIPITLGDVSGVAIRQPGRADRVVFFSKKTGPIIANTFTKNSSGVLVLSYDAEKSGRAWAARQLDSVPDFAIAAGSRVYVADAAPSLAELSMNGVRVPVTRAGDLVLATAAAAPLPPPTDPPPTDPPPPPPPTDTVADLIAQIQALLTRLLAAVGK